MKRYIKYLILLGLLTAFSLTSKGLAEVSGPLGPDHGRSEEGVNRLSQEQKDSALIDAAARGRIKMAAALLKAGANINATDDTVGSDPLMWASFLGKTEMARFLVQRGANIKAKNRKGWTAFLLACSKAHYDIVKGFISLGADLDVKTDDGWSALSIAYTKKDKKLIGMLLHAAARSPWAEAKVTKAGASNGCLPVMNTPISSGKQTGCLKKGEKLQLTGVWTDTDWALISSPEKGWIPGTGIGISEINKEKRAVIELKRIMKRARRSKGQTRSPSPRPSGEALREDLIDEPINPPVFGPTRKSGWH
jgi:hypothetical protein